MKTYIHKTKIIIDYQEVEVEVNYHMENDGIGAYEYWGARCFDAGHDYPEIDDIKPVFTDKKEQFERFIPVMKYIEKHFEELAEKLTEEIEKKVEPDYEHLN